MIGASGLPGTALFREAFVALGWLVAIAALGVFAATQAPLLLIGVPVAAGLIALVLLRPETAICFVVFALYAKLPDLAYQFHGVPKPIAASVPLLLGVPLVTTIIVRRRPIAADATFGWMLVFGLLMVTSGLVSKNGEAALEALTSYLLEGLLLYFLIVNVVRDLETLRRVVACLLLAGALMGGVTLVQELTGTHDNEYFGLAQHGGLFSTEEGGEKTVRGRAAGPIGEQNRYAQALLVLVPLGLFRHWTERRRSRRLLAAAATALIASGMLLSFSRGAFVALGLTVMVMVCLGVVRWRRVLLVGAVGCLIALAVAPEFFDRMGSIARVEALLTGTGPAADRPMLNRFAENRTAVHVFADHPLLGVGPGQFVFYTRQYADRLSLARQDRPYRAHNLFLEIGAETGLPGLLAFLAVVVSVMQALWRARGESHRHPDLASLATAFYLSLVAYLASGLFLHLAYQRYFWLLVALAAVAARIATREAARRDEEERSHAEATAAEGLPRPAMREMLG